MWRATLLAAALALASLHPAAAGEVDGIGTFYGGAPVSWRIFSCFFLTPQLRRLGVHLAFWRYAYGVWRAFRSSSPPSMAMLMSEILCVRV